MMPDFQQFIEPAGNTVLIKMRVKHQAPRSSKWFIKMIVGDTSIPVDPSRRSGNVFHSGKNERHSAGCTQGQFQVIPGQGNMPGRQRIAKLDHGVTGVTEHSPLAKPAQSGATG
ncbi:MAG: hypothetical protein CMK89_17040 [Pseudomonadales bacterium]|nr:hypothetical protein [Pseudomonadales bacterium]